MMAWIIPIVGVLGVGGTIAAAIFFPSIVIPILQSIMRCKPCLYALAVIVAMSGSWWHGNHTASVACRESELAAELRNKQIDLDNAHKAMADETERVKSIEDQANARQKNDADYIAHLEKRPACLLDDADVGGLQPTHGKGGKNASSNPK
jgi:hypothetical protein